MSQSIQAHTLIIRIQLDHLDDALRYKIDQVSVAEGKMPMAQTHFDCLHCKTRYFISPKIVVELEMIPDEKQAIEVKEETEFDWLESGSSMEVLSDDGGDEVQDLGREIPVVFNVNLKEERELDLLESGSSDELPSDDEADILQRVEHEISPEVPVKIEENVVIVPLARIDAEKKGQDRQKIQLQKRTSKPKRKRFTCDICKESIKTRSALVYHMNVFHLGVRFSCSECQVSFSAKNNLAKHKKLLHQIEIKGHRRPTESTHENQTFRCPQCDKDFSYKKSLQRHLSSHIM